MDQGYESLMSMSEHRPMVVSPYLSTQINEAICGCHCGCGCSCTGPGEENADYKRVDDGESETAVESSDPDDEEGFPVSQQTHDNSRNVGSSAYMNADILSPRAIMYQGRKWLLRDAGDVPSGEPLERWETQDDLEDGAESLFNEAPKTDSRSNAVSELESVRRMSPMSPGPGIGALFLPDDIEDIELVYYFDVRPLRLSPEFEHARGRAREHLLLPDDDTF